MIGGIIERELVMQSDLIVTVGLDAVELQPKPWPYTIPVISLSNTPSLEAMIPAQSEMVGNLKSMLAALAEFSPEAAAGASAAERSVSRSRKRLTCRRRLVAARGDGRGAGSSAAGDGGDLRCGCQPTIGCPEMANLWPP